MCHHYFTLVTVFVYVDAMFYIVFVFVIGNEHSAVFTLSLVLFGKEELTHVQKIFFTTDQKLLLYSNIVSLYFLLVLIFSCTMLTTPWSSAVIALWLSCCCALWSSLYYRHCNVLHTQYTAMRNTPTMYIMRCPALALCQL